MRTRPVALALLLAFAPAVTTIPSFAQGAAEDPTTDMARARFKEGVGFYDKGQFEQARVSFLQAYALKKHPAVLLNLAWSCLKSGHTLEAQRYFKQFLAEGKDATDKQRADANDGLTQSTAKLGRIDVVAATGTEVTVDGDRAGTTPLSDPIMVEPGAHTVKFKGPDGSTDTDSVTVLAGEKAIARFAKTASAAPAATPPTPAPAPGATPETDTTTPPSPPAEEAPAPAEAAHTKATAGASSHSSIFSPPETIAPVIVGGIISVASFGLAIGMSVAKHSAQNKANETAAQITTAATAYYGMLPNPPPSNPPPPITCNPPTPSGLTGIGQACTQWQNDNKQVNADATIGNIALGVGIVAALGTGIYWLVATKHGDSSSSGSIKPVVMPEVSPSFGGLSLSGGF